MANDKHVADTVVTALQGFGSTLTAIQLQLDAVRLTLAEIHGAVRVRAAPVDPLAPIPIVIMDSKIALPIVPAAGELAIPVKVTEPIPLKVLIEEAEKAQAKVDEAKEEEKKSEP